MRLRIKELLEEHRLTQKDLAALINNEQRNISNWELGVTEPDCETLVKLAEIFNVSMDELFGRDPLNYYGESSAARLPGVFHSLTDEQLQAVANLIKTFK